MIEDETYFTIEGFMYVDNNIVYVEDFFEKTLNVVEGIIDYNSVMYIINSHFDNNYFVDMISGYYEISVSLESYDYDLNIEFIESYKSKKRSLKLEDLLK